MNFQRNKKYNLFFIEILPVVLIGGIYGTILNMSGIDAARIAFAVWFMLPSILRMFFLILQAIPRWLLKLLLKCSRAAAGTTNSSSSASGSLTIPSESTGTSSVPSETVRESSEDSNESSDGNNLSVNPSTSSHVILDVAC